MGGDCTLGSGTATHQNSVQVALQAAKELLSLARCSAPTAGAGKPSDRHYLQQSTA